ncbi:hypothetical protein IKQ21_04545 [bacterium]|nr:hypothetical protein [bacterium]
MISKISLEDITEQNSIKSRNNSNKGNKSNPNFKGLGSLALAGIQACERMPMVNVAVIDMLSAILPRTIVESLTNWFAGFEAFRRESSGLVVNCMIPSAITYGIALCVNSLIMPKGTNLSSCWADRSLIDKTAEYYASAKSEDKVFESMKNVLSNIQGVDRDKTILFKDALSEGELSKYARKLSEISRKSENGKEVSEIADKIVAKTHISENIKIVGEKEVKASSVKSLLSDSVKFFREFQRAPEGTTIEQFAKQGKKLVLTKSLLGLSVVLPLAISMQYINRWITSKVSGVKGAPIYEDFGKGENIEESPKAKEGLLKQKIISISSMIGVSLLSMMKMPSMNMLEFKGKFPTMDQARIISTSTFASRMSAAEDKNELAESTIRDIATFCGLYFFGDYAAKGMATYLQKKTGVSLLNDTKPLKGNENIFERFIHWVKDVNIKSSEEVISKTKEMLKGAKPTEEQAKIIEKELKRATNLRAGCQYTNIGVSLALLGIIIPIFTRRNTKKKHEQALKMAQQKAQSSKKETNEESVTPLNVDYKKLTAGFRSMKQSA